MAQQECYQIVDLGRSENLRKVSGHHALAVRLPILGGRHDIGVWIDDRFADVAGRIMSLAVIVRRLDDLRRDHCDIAEVRADLAARIGVRDIVT